MSRMNTILTAPTPRVTVDSLARAQRYQLYQQQLQQHQQLQQQQSTQFIWCREIEDDNENNENPDSKQMESQFQKLIQTSRPLTLSTSSLEEFSLQQLYPVVAKNGTGLAMLPPPRHISGKNSALPEETIKQDPNLLARLLVEDAQRYSNPSRLLNRIVFDSIDPPLFNQNMSQANGNTANSFLNTYTTSYTSTFDTLHQVFSIPSYSATSVAGNSKDRLKQYYIPDGSNDNTLIFESRFESGNLRRAVQIYPHEYDLILRFDVNTRGHTQWFYFSVQNAQKGVKYKFNIINMMKPDSLYNYGMKPLIYSEYESKHHNMGWKRCGEDICYYQNSIKRKSGFFYTFTWSHTFEHANDTCYFSYCYPYTYTDLQNYLNGLERDSQRRKCFRRRTLCQTLCGNNCDVLTITTFSCDPQELRNRRGVVITGRVHPGESNSSWMMKGVIDFLTGNTMDAQVLRDNFIFKIVPMLNPDGVIAGNYRSSLTGEDLNRKWLDPSKKLNPTIYHTKQMIKQMVLERQVMLFCDFHGHSRKKNIFMYGCSEKSVPHTRISTKVFPRLLWKMSQNFSYEDCSFGVQRCKESTARVVVYKQYGIENSYTLEASFCGPDFGRFNDKHFNIRHLEQMGQFFCETILDYCDPDQIRTNGVIRELDALHYESPSDDSDGSIGSTSNDDELGTVPDPSKKKKKKKKKKKGTQKKPSSASSTSTTASKKKKNKNKVKNKENKEKGSEKPEKPEKKPKEKSPAEPSTTKKLAKKDSQQAVQQAPVAQTVKKKKPKKKKEDPSNTSPLLETLEKINLIEQSDYYRRRIRMPTFYDEIDKLEYTTDDEKEYQEYRRANRRGSYGVVVDNQKTRHQEALPSLTKSRSEISIAISKRVSSASAATGNTTTIVNTNMNHGINGISGNGIIATQQFRIARVASANVAMISD